MKIFIYLSLCLLTAGASADIAIRTESGVNAVYGSKIPTDVQVNVKSADIPFQVEGCPTLHAYIQGTTRPGSHDNAIGLIPDGQNVVVGSLQFSLEAGVHPQLCDYSVEFSYHFLVRTYQVSEHLFAFPFGDHEVMGTVKGPVHLSTSGIVGLGLLTNTVPESSRAGEFNIAGYDAVELKLQPVRASFKIWDNPYIIVPSNVNEGYFAEILSLVE